MPVGSAKKPNRMKLLYLAIAYLLGVAAGQILWKQGWFGCGIGGLSWTASLVFVCGCLWMDASGDRRTVEPLRWLASAGFSPPRGTFSVWFTGAIVLAGICGFLRLGSHPPLPCPGPSDLAYYNLDSGESISRVTIADGYVASYPTLADGRQRLDIKVESVEVDGHRKKVNGRLRLQTNADYRFRFGESVRVRGLLTEPPVFEGFDYRGLPGAQTDSQPDGAAACRTAYRADSRRLRASIRLWDTQSRREDVEPYAPGTLCGAGGRNAPWH